MGFFTKLFGGDAGIREAMHETYNKVKSKYPPNTEEYEILALVLHARFRSLTADKAMLISVICPTIEELTEWVIGLENHGGPRNFDEFLAFTTTYEQRERALNYLQEKAREKGF
jgi:hypothetical protein